MMTRKTLQACLQFVVILTGSLFAAWSLDGKPSRETFAEVPHSAGAKASPRAPLPQELLTTPDAAWPVFRGNSLATGVAPGKLPDQPDLLWKYVVPKGAFDTTAAIANDVVYLGDLDGTVYALNLADGSEVWKKTLGESGFSAATAIRNGLVYVGDQDGMFYALSAKNGDVLWKHEGRGQLYGANFHQDRVLFGAQDGTLHCLHSKTGEPIWTFQIPDQIRCSPSVVDGHAFLVGCDGKLHIIDIAAGKSAGEVPLNAPAGSTAAASGDWIYFGTSAGEFLCVDWKKRQVIWTFQDKARQQPISGSAALTADAVYVPGEDRTLRAFRAVDGNDLWKQSFKAKLDGSPVVVGERLWIGGHDGRITALELASGKKVWEYQAGGRFPGSAAVASGKLVIANDDGTVFCFGAK
jgi:outer membrane protein assembly factor BamB